MKKFLLIVLTLGAIGAIVAMVMKKRSAAGSDYADSLVSAAEQAAEATSDAVAEAADATREAVAEAMEDAAERVEG